MTALCVATVASSPAAAQTAPEADVPATEQTPVGEDAATQADIDAAAQAEIDAALAEDAPHCSGTGIEGVVRDGQTQETLIEAPVLVIGRGRRVLTDYDGRFAIDLPPGTYSLRSYYDLYQPARVDDVVVTAGNCTQQDLELSSETSTGEEIVIEVRAQRGTSASQLRMRRESVATQDSISSEEMRRAPDSTASDSARRVVGVTILNDYLYVRGLGGRYVSVLMNGVALPQTDPDVPGVQLDILPTSMLESLTIRKTFTPEIPGDFAGGSLDISSQQFPAEFTLRAGLSLGANTGVTFQDTLGYQQGSLDFLGVDDGTRAIPESVRDTVLRGAPADVVGSAATAFPNNWGLTRRTAWPNLSASLSMGDTLDIDGHMLGYLVLVGYRYSERPIEDVIGSARVQDGVVVPRETLTQEGVERDIGLSGMASVTYELAEHNMLSLVGLVSQNAEDYVGRIRGFSETVAANIDAYRLDWVQRTMAFGQLVGEHTDLPGSARFRWQLNVSHGDRDEPDLRDIQFNETDRGPRWSPGANSGQRFYSSLDDLTYGGGGDLTVPIDQVTLRAGGLVRQTDRTLDTRRFNWLTGLNTAPGVLLEPVDVIFSPQTIESNLRLDESTRADDSYDASVSLLAAYASAEWQPLQLLRFYGGVRAESFRQVVTSGSPFGNPADVPSGTRRTDVDLLPAVGTIIEVADDVFVRAGYGGTVARPQVREVAPFLYIDFIRRRQVTGNPELERTYIHNFDVRLEWFPSESEVLAASAFVKVFESPIEPQVVSESGLSFANVEGANNFGGELEARAHLGHIHDSLEWISVGLNAALIYSRAALSPEQLGIATSDERPLAGQTPVVVNASLGLQPPDTNLEVFVFYTYWAPTLLEVGQQGLPDAYRSDIHQLDAAVRWTPISNMTLSLQGRNVMNWRQTITQGDVIVTGLSPGVQVSLGLSVRN